MVGPEMACALGVIKGTQIEVESQYNQVGNVLGCLIGGGGWCGHDGVGNAQRDSLLLFNWEVFDPICFESPGEALVQSDARLGIRGLSGFGESIQEVGLHNLPPCLRNWLSPKSTHSVLGVLDVTDLVPVNLEDLGVSVLRLLYGGIRRE